MIELVQYPTTRNTTKRTTPMYTKIRRTAKFLSGLASVILLAAAPAAMAADKVLDEIVAVVNDGVVLKSDLAAENRFIALRAKAARQPLPAAQVLQKQIMDRLIDREIQKQRADKLGIEVDQSSVNRAIEKVAAGNNLNSFEFRESLKNQGFDYAYYRAGVEHELLVSRLVRREVRDSITVTEKEIDDFLASQNQGVKVKPQYRLRHILIAAPQSASKNRRAAARLKALQAIGRVRNNENFGQLATEISDGSRAAQGGDLGWREADELPPFISDSLPNLEKGDLSEPLESPDGYHVIFVEDIRSGPQQEVSEETRLRHIFIASESDQDGTDARKTLESLRARIQSGESFAELAREFSKDPDSAGNGGELPWIAAGQMPPQMESVAAELAPGQLSRAFRTQFGWHLMEVLERRAGSSGDSRLRAEATQALQQRKFDQEIDRWQRTLREESFVDILNASQ